MIRKAFVMFIRAGQEAEYERRHRPIWDELAATLRAHGVHNYSIFLDEPTRTLFGYAEIESEESWQAIARTEVGQRWLRHMAERMPANPDFCPAVRGAREILHLD